MSTLAHPDSYYFENLTASDESIRMKSVVFLHAQYHYLIKTYCIRQGLDQSNGGLQSDLESIYNQIIADLYLKIYQRSFTEGPQLIKSRIFFLIEKRYLDLKRTRGGKTTTMEIGEELPLLQEPESIKEVELRKQERIDVVLAALRSLEGNDCTEILTRYFFRKEKLKNIAAAINQSYGTVRNKIGTCKQELQKILEERFDFKKEHLWT